MPQTKVQPGPMMRRWAEIVREHGQIEEFINWCDENVEGFQFSYVESPTRALQRYFEIDMAKLDEERRTILEATSG